MNPTQQQLDDLQNRVAFLESQLRQFLNAAELDPQIVRTMTQILATSSDKLATSEDQFVNEAGTANYNVLKPPARFIKIGDNNVPAYD